MPVIRAEIVHDTWVGDEAGVPNATVVVAPAVGVLFADHVYVPIVVDALNMAGNTVEAAAAPY